MAKADLHSIIEKMNLFDVKIFKSTNIDNDNIRMSGADLSERDIDQVTQGKDSKNSEIFEVKTHSLRDIFLSSSKELDGLQF